MKTVTRSFYNNYSLHYFLHVTHKPYIMWLYMVLVINWLNRQVTENQLGRPIGQPGAGAFEMNSTSRAMVNSIKTPSFNNVFFLPDRQCNAFSDVF